ncbi:MULTISPECIES: flavodoxin family protein [unclassified Sedimentibacter]|uniref:flavodoxin family protein n=1 Tax=unclassified Sedimentibacter TaxID=2649220 RepID=UPI0027DF6DDF|nr:flavodoxin family protein [Sedimentibacter sp. MB35-C1]WMJ76347.1 flavodoxin family protein [Sedimentibacter sp. MB35-C1]
MRLIIHDLSPEQVQKILPHGEDVRIISKGGSIHPCIGCFGCWIKTPAQCIIRDQYGNMGEFLSKCDELILISRCVYGGFSPFIKNVLDRSISYIHPYFITKNGEIHHRARYNHNFNLSVYFYGNAISEREKCVARDLVKANSINLHCNIKNICFETEAEALGGRI